MRRVMFTVVATVLMAGAVPAAALAHHGHHKHHARHHARIRRFGDQNTQPTSTSPSDNAGKVVDFSKGVLTIQLNDGSTVKGMVTNDTEIECTSTQQSQTSSEDSGDGSGDQSSGSGDQSSGSSDQSSGSSDQSSGDDDQSQSQSQSSSCSSSSLADGAVVHDASLRIGGSGPEWQKVELVS